MEMPVICTMCNQIVELHSTKESRINKVLLCENCYEIDDQVADLFEENKTIQNDLDNHEEYMKGDRRGWRKKIKENKEKINSLGYEYPLSLY